ncbi:MULTISPECIES: 30S ribosomal protein S3 [Halococcus]|uniref:Small ribosomal subunit protein uS3 n=1 Tax=Halococcus salifodinae DSM 8989 TaxID=1227456 RepID=M0MUY3_9EURY|nr:MULTISPECIES: 30S ribosomal protein S3 [Halococcus]EMA49133.1 30S ribosomal protein S3P [Halococcus salifodinae DSM 8989]
MGSEQTFIEDGMQRTQIDEFFGDELERAGYGGMDLAKTPMGTQIVLRAEKPGMVIGKGGKNIRKITTQLEERFDLDDPQIDVQEVDEPDLNAQIVADRLGNALERGWYFRKAGHTTIDRIMDAGARGAEITLNGKVTGARSRNEKFNRGYIKHNGEPAQSIVDRGDGVAVMKLGTIGVTVRIIPPDAELPDDFRIQEDVDTSVLEPEEVEGDDVEELLSGEGEADEPVAGPDESESDEDFEVTETPPEGDAEATGAEEIIEEEIESEQGSAETSPEEPAEAGEDIDEELSEETDAAAEAIIDEMDDAEAGGDLTVIDGVGDAKADALVEAGFESVADVRAASEDDLAEAEGVGPAFAERIKAGAEEFDGGDA